MLSFPWQRQIPVKRHLPFEQLRNNRKKRARKIRDSFLCYKRSLAVIFKSNQVCGFLSRNPGYFRVSHFQTEAKCKIFLVKMSFICMRIKNGFHINSFAPSLALKQRHGATQKCMGSLYSSPSAAEINPHLFYLELNISHIRNV